MSDQHAVCFILCQCMRDGMSDRSQQCDRRFRRKEQLVDATLDESELEYHL